MSPVAIVIIAVVVGVAAYIFYRIWLTEKNGIEAEAFVSFIDENVSVDSEGSSTSYTYYVKYKDAEGRQQQAKITNVGFSKGPVMGERIRVKYLPQKPQAVVWLKR